MYCIDTSNNHSKQAVANKKILESQILRNQSSKERISLSFVIKLMFKVVQQKIRHTIMFFSLIAAKCLCGIISWVIVIFGSMFFATKVIYTSPSSTSDKKVPVPEFLENLSVKCIHHQKQISKFSHLVHHNHQQQKQIRIKPTFFKPEYTIPEPFYDCFDPILSEKKGHLIELRNKNTNKKDQTEERVEEIVSILKTKRGREIHRPLERRISNVERFMKECTPETPEVGTFDPKKSKIMFAVVYFSCAFVAAQFYILLAVLLSSNIPIGLLFLVVCLAVIVGLIGQIVFAVDPKEIREPKTSEKKETSDASQQTMNKIILEFEKKGKPVAPVKPFILLKVASKCDLLKGLKKQGTNDLLKKKN
jgi:Na+-transporting methylmalonyl-CoA/oxaloacetate decarboxylase gamma subunit